VTFVYAYDHRHDLPFDQLKLLLGGKAAGLNAMAVELGLPVPPAFVLTTGACNRYLADGWPDGLDDEIRQHMAALEAAVGRRFGDPADPLLVSVRSGAPVSMPGMMETILNLGLNEETEHGLATASGDPEFARSCRDRFQALYRGVVGTPAPTDPWQQLRGAIEAVFRSWNGDKARTYRAHEGISETLGTGVVVQAMVFGNLGDESGTGVLFTRNPATGENVPYGDVVFRGQGEDVVAGGHDTLPVARLDDRMPEVAAELHRHAAALEHHFGDARDIEFTIERRRLWLLQDRTAKRTDSAAVRMAVEMAGDPTFPLTREQAVRRVAAILAEPPRRVVQAGDAGEALTRGLGVSPGVVCGEVALTVQDAVERADAGRDVILVRAETSPDDVHGMARAQGILTATGGFASHAAVVARGWNKPAVVGASAVVPDPVGGVVVIAGRRFSAGSLISIDGSTGEVFEGHADGVEQVAPEARTLLGWAMELGIAIGDSADRAESPSEPRGAPGSVSGGASPGASADDLLRAMLVKGYCAAPGAATALGCENDVAQRLLDGLVAEDLAEPAVGSFRLTAAGREAAARLLTADAERWGTANAQSALDAFVALDGRMKAVVTAWQMKDPQTLNDHADSAYDAEVLARLASLHDDVRAWLEPLTAGLPRLARYGARLAAGGAAAAGDGRYIASPRVDSYHGAWFELHEDLILLAGRTRADEVAAGRA
jgi:pyruvate,orthophosphate dikinase